MRLVRNCGLAGSSRLRTATTTCHAHSGHGGHPHRDHPHHGDFGHAANTNRKHDDLSGSARAQASASYLAPPQVGVDTGAGRDMSNVSNDQLSQFRALVLDVSYRPIDTLPWTRAVVLDYFDKVDVLEYYDSFVRSAREHHYLPAVLVIPRYVKKIAGALEKGVPLTRKNVYARDHHECQYCSSKKNLTLDHVIPTSKGGGTTWDNLVAACNKCNQQKGDKLLKDLKGKMKLKRAPKQPSHYELSSYMIRAHGVNGANGSGVAPKEWQDYLPPGAKDTLTFEDF
mmetsp:Transcript_16846/g.38080  ORF Transcript_16846/g.38080 Transcript_16846/m.38080 type:complete len:284 (+) Transcript_16846:229-1080(+)